MSTTTPTEFVGIPSLSEEKIATIKGWYHQLLGDSDKASDPEDGAYYQGSADAFEGVLRLLHNMPQTDEQKEAGQ